MANEFVARNGIIAQNNSAVSGSLTVTGDIKTEGNVIAQQFIISSSVAYITESFASGSHIFGNSIDDTHRFTGSVLISGSLKIPTAPSN